MEPLNILVGCEESQAVTMEFRKLGHNAFSNDIIPCSGPYQEFHLLMDVFEAIKYKNWDAAIFFTPCTYSCNSGVRWIAKNGVITNYERYYHMVQYALMLRDTHYCDIHFVANENPVPHGYALQVISRKYDQIIQPWQFGHGETKATCLWLKNLPPLVPTDIVEGREARIHKMAPGPDRSKERSKTYPGIAKAMAEQWSEHILKCRNNAQKSENKQFELFTTK